MKYSFQYYFTAFYIKLKGIKKIFSRSIIDYRKIRKEDVHIPPNSFFKNAIVNQFKIANTTITEIKNYSTEMNLLIFVHGGGFVSGPNQLHWDVIKK